MALGVLGVLGVCALSAPYTVDDAFIVARYAQNLASGHGYAMNPDVPSDGITGPLWLVPPLLAAFAGVDPVLAAKLVGALCAALTAWLVVRWAERRALGRAACWVSGGVLMCLPDVGTWSVSGLETGAALLALTALAFALLGRDRSRLGLAVLATTALAWLRPEAAPCVSVLWLAPITRTPRSTAPWALAALLGAASVVAFRWAMFGHALPLSASAKPAELAHGAPYALLGVVLMTSGVGVALAALGAVRGHREDRWLLGALAAHVVAIALAGGDWMPGARLLVPIAGGYALLVGRGFVQLAKKRRGLAIAALMVSLSVPLLDLAVRVPELRASAAQREHAAARLAQDLRARGGTVALLDAGYLAYASGLPVVDLGGLTDSHIASLPGGHIDKRIDEAYLRERDPSLLVLHSSRPPELGDQNELLAFSGYPVELRVAALPWVRSSFRFASYVELRRGYGYVVLERAVSPAR